jgi:Branched-chain amino acid permeases
LGLLTVFLSLRASLCRLDYGTGITCNSFLNFHHFLLKTLSTNSKIKKECYIYRRNENVYTKVKHPQPAFYRDDAIRSFFGAGNLIFPVFVGQQAGTHYWPALIGFLISGVGLPLLGVAAIGITKSDGVFQLSQKVNRFYAYAFTVLLYLCIGPLFALPRLASISFEVGDQSVCCSWASK